VVAKHGDDEKREDRAILEARMTGIRLEASAISLKSWEWARLD